MKDQAKLVASFNMDNLTRKRFFFFLSKKLFYVCTVRITSVCQYVMTHLLLEFYETERIQKYLHSGIIRTTVRIRTYEADFLETHTTCSTKYL